MIVVLEGVDASGKATQSRRLVKNLEEAGVRTMLFDFPRYDTYTGRSLKALLKREWFAARKGEVARPTGADTTIFSEIDSVETVMSEDPKMTALMIQALHSVNRFEHYPLLKEWAESDGVLVLDRYYGSTLAYGAADGLDHEFLYRVHTILPTPDLWIFLDVPPEESVSRRPARRDEYEAREGFLATVREKYLELVENPPDNAKWCRVDGTGSEDEVAARIFLLVAHHVLGYYG